MAWNTIVKKKSEGKRATRNRLALLHPSDENSSPEESSQENKEKEVVMDKHKDLHSGMELLELDFLLSVVESTGNNDPNDVTMRKLNFNELLRRGKQDQIDSNALKVYAVNAGNPYGKDLQCEATKELAKRTPKQSDHSD